MAQLASPFFPSAGSDTLSANYFSFRTKQDRVRILDPAFSGIHKEHDFTYGEDRQTSAYTVYCAHVRISIFIAILYTLNITMPG